MSTVDSTTSSSSALAASSASKQASATTSSSDDIQNRFLTLLVAQLENQDPLNPLDNTEITSQLAQMSTVQGIEQLNSSFSSLMDNLAETQALQASSMIGKTVLVPGNTLTLAEGTAYGGVYLDRAVEEVTVTILDSSGDVVQTQTLGKSEAGSLLFSWDGATSEGGTAEDGSYTFKVSARSGAEAVTANAYQLGTVSALVRTASNGFQLDLGSLGTYDFNDVQQVF